MLNRSASLKMSTSVLKVLPGKLDIKRHSPSILKPRRPADTPDNNGINLFLGEMEFPIKYDADKSVLSIVYIEGSQVKISKNILYILFLKIPISTKKF